MDDRTYRFAWRLRERVELVVLLKREQGETDAALLQRAQQEAMITQHGPARDVTKRKPRITQHKKRKGRPAQAVMDL